MPQYTVRNQTFLPVLVGSVQLPPVVLRGPVALDDLDMDYNVFFGIATDIMVEWQNPPLGVPSQMTLSQWQAISGQDSHSRLFPYPPGSIVAQNVQKYLDPGFYHVETFIPGPCCAHFWLCTGTVGADPCVDPTLVHFIQYADNGGADGWTNRIVHYELDALFERWTYCGACGEDGLLATIPTHKII